ncbi:MAG: PQQ-binding-like beta-propeller repeat protein [Rubripirellula sp.]
MNLNPTSKWLAILLIALNLGGAGNKHKQVSGQEMSWSQFLGDDGRGVSNSNPATTWNQKDNVDWRTELPGRGWSSPVVAGDKVFVTSAIPLPRDLAIDPQEVPQRDSDVRKKQEQNFELCLLVVDLESGELVKTIPVMVQNDEKPSRMHGKNSHASPTPIISKDRIYVHFGYQGTACLTLAGEIVWINRELYFPPTHGNGGSPILVDSKLVFTCDGGKEPKVVALDAATGQVAWEVARDANARKTFSFCTPTEINVKGRTLVITPGSDGVAAIDPSTSEVVWSFRYSGYSVVPKPIVVDGLVVISTGFDEARMLAIDPKGSGDVTESHLAWEVDRNVPKTPSMIAKNGLIYSISDDGIALCIKASDGEIQYRKRIGGNYSASPVLAGGKIYFTSEAGKTTVVREGAEFEVISESDLKERTLATMAIAGESLLIRTDNALYRIND